MAYTGISDIVTASVNSDKTSMKMLMLIMNITQEAMVFHGRQKLTSAYETMARKVMVDFKFDAVYV